MGDLLDHYEANSTWDEMFDEAGRPRSAYTTLHQALQTLSEEDFESRCAARDRAFRDQGITFS